MDSQKYQRRFPDVVCLGELLIDLVPEPSGATPQVAPSLRIAPGGAPANVAVALKRLGVQTGFIGKVGDDPFGRFLRSVLSREGIDLRSFKLTPKSLTRLACVTNDSNEQQRFIFYGNPGADVLLAPRDIQMSYLKHARALHFGSISLIQEPARSATIKALDIARANGLMISFDPNLRPALWPNLEKARKEILSSIKRCQILKLSESEWEFLFPYGKITECYAIPQLQHLRLLAVTLGKSGAIIATPQGQVRTAGIQVQVADTTGAGDGFMAGVLYWLVSKHLEKQEDSSGLRKIVQFANMVGALTCARAGAIPAFPVLDEVLFQLARVKKSGKIKISTSRDIGNTRR